MEVVFATFNAHKRLEVEAIMRGVWPEIRLISPAGEAPEENAASFEGNALIKARAAFATTGLPSLADDSGVCVTALGGRPGIDSAHYGGTRVDEDNVRAVLRDMEGQADRSASFVCAAAFVDAGGEHVVEREWKGSIAGSPSGAGGFGYDPVFIPEGLEVTAAELSADDKNARSHRGQAFAEMAGWLRDHYAH